MRHDQRGNALARLEEIRQKDLNLFRLKVRPHRVRLSCGNRKTDAQAISPGTQSVLSLLSDDAASVDTEWDVFQFLQVHVDILSEDDDEFMAIRPDQDGFRTLGHIDANESCFASQFVVPDSQFRVLTNLATSHPDSEIQMHLHCREPLANWDGRQRVHVVRASMESWMGVSDDTTTCALRDPRNPPDPIALLEDIHAIPHIPEFRNLRQTVQFTAALLVLTFVLLLWFGFSGKS